MNGSTSDVMLAEISGQGWMGKDTGARVRPTREEIAMLAYQRYIVNGRRDGHDVEDWLLAERELAHHYA